MKKFIKFCFIMAMILIIVGGAFYMLGRKEGQGRREMNELLEEIGVDWLDLDFDDLVSIAGSEMSIVDTGIMYDLNDASIFNDNYDVMSGSLDKTIIYREDDWESITMVHLEIGGSMVEIEDSDDGNAYIEGRNVGKLQAYVEDGVLWVKSVRPANLMDEIKSSEITLYLPVSYLDLLDVSLGAGQLELEHLSVQTLAASVGAGQLLLEDMDLGTLEVSLGAGELQAEDVTVEYLSASVGAGNMEFSGDIYRNAVINCSMGNVSMELKGDTKDYNYRLNCIAGNIEIDEESFAGAAMERNIDNNAAKTMEIDCSMGNVEVDF